MEVPGNIFYTKDHEWVSGKDGVVTLGISAFALEQLGDIVHLELPEVGESFEKGDTFGTIESTKTVSDLYVPAKGTVTEINKEVLENPELLSDEPYEKWLIKYEIKESSDILLGSKEYQEYLSAEA